MNYLEELKYILESNWTPDRNGRLHKQEVNGYWYELPDITHDNFQIALENSAKEQDLGTDDAIVIVDTAGLDREPSSVGYNEEQIVAQGAIRVKSTDRQTQWDSDGDGDAETHYIDGRQRVFGFFNGTGGTVTTNDGTDISPGEHEESGGLVGEVDRCFKDTRRGNINWDVIIPNGFEDISNNMNYGTYAAEAEIVLTKHADELN